jgi:aminopeptidase YwaD
MNFHVSQESLLRHLRKLVGERNPLTSRAALDAAADYIIAEFRSLGLPVAFDSFELFSQTHHNIIADFPAAQSSPLLIVGAHYDSVPHSPAADDNASGVAALLEIARIFSGQSLPIPLRLIAFTLEESDLAGSRHYVRRLQASGESLLGMVSLEMLGYKSDEPNSQKLPPALAPFYPHTANFIGAVGNERSRRFLETFVRGMKATADLPIETLVVPGNGEPIIETRFSDHSPFWDAGHCAIMVNDTSFFRNPHYHQPTDTLDTLDLNFLCKTTEAAARGIDAVLKSSC